MRIEDRIGHGEDRSEAVTTKQELTNVVLGSFLKNAFNEFAHNFYRELSKIDMKLMAPEDIPGMEDCRTKLKEITKEYRKILISRRDELDEIHDKMLSLDNDAVDEMLKLIPEWAEEGTKFCFVRLINEAVTAKEV